MTTLEPRMSHSATLTTGERIQFSDHPLVESEVYRDYGLCTVTLGGDKYVCGYVRYDRGGRRHYYPVSLYGARAGRDNSCIIILRIEPYMKFISPHEVQVYPHFDPLGILNLIGIGNILESTQYFAMSDDERAAVRARRCTEQRQFGLIQGLLLGLINIGQVHTEDVRVNITSQLAEAMPRLLKLRFHLNTAYDGGTRQGVDLLAAHLEELLDTAATDTIGITPVVLLDILEELIPLMRSHMTYD